MYSVKLHSSYRTMAKYWCKSFLRDQQYHCEQSSDEDAWIFEKLVDANAFTLCVKRYYETAESVGVPGP